MQASRGLRGSIGSLGCELVETPSERVEVEDGSGFGAKSDWRADSARIERERIEYNG